MGTMVLSSQDCLQKPLAADAFRQPQPPPRSHRHRTGHRPRQTMTAAASPASRVAHSPTTKPLPRRGCAGPIRPRRSPEYHRRMVVRRPVIKELVIGEVTILRRCPAAATEEEEEDYKPVVPEGAAGDLELCSTKRLGPDPAKLPKRTRLMDQTKPQHYHYAGSGFLITSPPPSSLPLPTSFLAKKVDAGDAADVATVALRCLLRLDLP